MSLFAPGRRTKPVLLATATALVASFALAGCGSSGSSNGGSANGTTTISFMETMAASTQKSVMQKLTSDFEKANPKIKVQLIVQPDYGTLQAKETAAVSAHNAPTIAQMYPDWAATFAKSQVILPVSTYAGTSSPSQLGDFYAGVRNELSLPDGKLWLWPFNKSVEVMYDNPAMLKAKGLSYPKTWDEFATDAKKLSNGNVVAISTDPGTPAAPAGGTIWLETLDYANGGTPFAKDGTPQFTSPQMVKALTLLAQMKKDGSLTLGTNYPGETSLAAAKGAFDIGSSAGYYYENQAVGKKFTLGTNDLPTGPAGQANVLQGTDIGMFASASKAQQAAAWKYMQFLTQPANQATWAAGTGYLPVTAKALPSMKAYVAQNPWVPTSMAALQNAKADPPYSWVTPAEGALVVAIQAVVDKGTSPAAALAAAQKTALAAKAQG
ncbi:extracellular solute-binding protein [Streptomyces sp. SL13]|uniref:Extracellular solute-binding protein n=1 Tax=Streptantibioticus silvisoli TaxID=2705255 RepID=A0AA90KEV7_9ACTN|nr:extracellular solute-binding protein [Streptantibioticus silvisoli]MDI5967477.1 extracellular solute-binding protein [Streptantibioticus silvisoli]MDI5968249.1 extracellular solute-binding protein [Streptantibioticus silvisoli]